MYSLWNDTSVTYICIRIMSKSNYPYNENLLTHLEYTQECELLKGLNGKKKISKNRDIL